MPALPSVPTGSIDWDAEYEPVHLWFGLTYSNYLVIPRTLLQSMPVEWQRSFVKLLDQAQAGFEYIAHADYWVRAREGNRFIEDPVPNYNRGRAHVEWKPTGLQPAASEEKP